MIVSVNSILNKWEIDFTMNGMIVELKTPNFKSLLKWLLLSASSLKWIHIPDEL